jgi:hypothetical protein
MPPPASVSRVATFFTKPAASKRYPKSALINSFSTHRHALPHVVSHGPLQMGWRAHHVWFPRLPWMQARHESSDTYQCPRSLSRASGRHSYQGCPCVVCPLHVVTCKVFPVRRDSVLLWSLAPTFPSLLPVRNFLLDDSFGYYLSVTFCRRRILSET